MPIEVPRASHNVAPSEIVLLNGEQFAARVPQRVGLPQFSPRLLNLSGVVSRHDLLVAAISVALLSAEQNGEISLTIWKERGIFSQQGRLVNSQRERLLISQKDDTGRWPQGSLEARIGTAFAKRSRMIFPNDTVAELVELIVNVRFWHDISFFTRHPETHLIASLVKALAKRGLVDTIPDEGKLFGVIPFGPPRVFINEQGIAAVAQHNIASIKKLMSTCKKARPKIWHLLENEIVSGLANAEPSSD